MGKKKSRKMQQKATKPKVDTVFDCPFCNHPRAVEIKLYYTLCARHLTSLGKRTRDWRV